MQAEVTSGTFAQADPIISLMHLQQVSMQATAPELRLVFEGRCGPLTFDDKWHYHPSVQIHYLYLINGH